MAWLTQNWIWILFSIAFVSMHLFGHGCHGGHGSHRSGRDDADEESPTRAGGARSAALQALGGSHRN